MDDLLHRPLPFLRPLMSTDFRSDMEPFNPAKMRSVSTSTPILTREMVDQKTPKVTRSMSTGQVNDSGFDESFTDSCCGDETMCMSTPSTVYRNEKCTPVTNFNDMYKYRGDSVLDESYTCAFNVKVNRFFETPGSTFFADTIDDCDDIRESKRSKRQSVNIPSYSLNLDLEPCPMELGTEDYTSSLVERFDEVMLKFSPIYPEKVIGRKMGLDHVDIISELSDRNISCSAILQYLDPKDLCSMCEVSRRWQTVCNGDPVSRKRKRSITDRLIIGKENAGKRSPPKQFRGLTDSQTTLAPLQLIGKLTKQLTPCSIKVNLFQKAASSLKNDEKLRKCPKCSKVSKVLPVQERGQCQNLDCLFDFCTKCFYNFHGSKPCVPMSPKKAKTTSIGGKKSKKNLRRL
ncbi:F-box only protein 5-like [Mytilus trossulus]|uniref:F-box only protein 5-like n=1 Tax=Mytilus trossulus TaxID=6551 RepID=UPI003006BACB